MTTIEAEPQTLRLSHKLERLVARLQKEFAGKQAGHCVRVDHLNVEEARVACAGLRAAHIENLDAYVLQAESQKTAELPDALSLYSDQAIERRNRKQASLCIFIPADLRDATASSLGNSFAPFDMPAFLKTVVWDLKASIPETVQDAVNAAHRQLHGRASVSLEQEIDYLSAILDAPTPKTVGMELWRVGLIPDSDMQAQADIPEWTRRLELNRKCVDQLARPLRPQSSVADRITALRLKPGTIQTALAQFLIGRRLQSDTEWLRELAAPEQHGKLTFDCWQFPEVEPSDLESVEVEPFTAYTSGLKEVGTGAMPYAECRPKQKVTIKWKPTPPKPTNVGRWRIEMIPSRGKYAEDEAAGIDLPQLLVKGNVRTAKLSLDLEPEDLPVREVEVRVVALDGNDVEIQDVGGNPVADYSQPFYLEGDVGIEEPNKPRRLPTDRSFSDALLAYSLRTKEEEISVEAQAAEEHDLLYLPFLIGGKTSRKREIARLETTVFLRDLQQKTLQNADSGGRYRAETHNIETLRVERVETRLLAVPSALAESWDKFVRARRTVFDTIRKKRDSGEGLVETVELTSTFCSQVQKYAQTYQELLDAAGDVWGGRDDHKALAELLELDTLVLDFGRSDRQRVTVVLPTHPLRLLWYVSYARWVEDVAAKLRSTPSRERAARFNKDSLRRLAPLNLPAFLARQVGGQGGEVFADNLNLFYGVLLPFTVSDPGALLADTARALGFGAISPSLTDARPEQLGEEIKSYNQLHPYLHTLRINVVNPGSGEFLRHALLDALKVERDSDGETMEGGLHLDLLTQSESSIQTPASGLEALSAEWYSGGNRRRGDHLRPGIQIARQRLTPESLDTLPGGDVHLAVCQDYFKPTLGIEAPPQTGETEVESQETSAAVFGLLTRFQSTFRAENDTVTWQRKVGFSGTDGFERHPIHPAYANLLIEGQEAYLRLCACVISGSAPQGLRPALHVCIEPEARKVLDRLHDQADWVITLDRHFGVEYYDSPLNPSLDRAAERYLLDYAPEFLEGLGHRLIVTTGWQEEVAGVLGRAMDALGLARNASSVSELLTMLKLLSGRLALRLIGDENDTQAKETVGLAVVMNYLLRRGDLLNTIVIPVDAHHRLFYQAKQALDADSASRCDLLLVRPQRLRLSVECVEVKFRKGDGSLLPDCEKIAHQNLRTDKTLRALYFSDPPRLDAPILRCQFAAILRFYAERAYRHGRIVNEGQYHEILDNIARMEMGLVKMISRHTGYLVTLNSHPRKSFKQGETTIHVLTGTTIETETAFERSNIGISGEAPALSVTDLQPASGPATKNNTPQVSVETPQTTPPTEATPVSDSHPGSLQGISGDNAVIATEEQARDLVIPLGRDVYNDEEIAWVGSVQGSPHLFVLGIPGQGKTWTVLRLVSEAARQGVGSLTIDFHGQFAQPAGPLAEISPRVIDIAQGLPFSPFDARSYRGAAANYWKTNAIQVSEIFQYICKLGEMQRDLVYEAISACYKEAGFADHELNEDEPPLTAPTVSEVYTRLQSLEKGRRGAQNTVARCRPLFEFDLFRDGVEEPLDFVAMRRTTTVIDLHNEGVETLQMAAGAFVLRKLYKDMFSWGQADHLRLMVVLDEAHRLAKDVTLPKLMKEGRKFGIAVVVASQSAQDFHPDVLQNAGTKVMFRTNYPLSRRVAGYLRTSNRIPDVASALENLQVGHALIQTVQMSHTTKLAMYPPQDHTE